ncbi:MAG: DUF695 domain-containing protein [Chitinophagales bacterium]
MKNFVALCGYLLCAVGAFAQGGEGNWEVYISKFSNGPASVAVDMDFDKSDTTKANPFLLVFTIQAKDCDEKGFPQKREFDNLYAIADTVEAIVKAAPRGFLVGTYTNDCYYQCYYYMADTTLLRPALKVAVEKNFPAYKTFIRIEADVTHHAYHSFLYPSEEMQEYMADQKVILQLRQQGDNLRDPHKLEHFLYFRDKQGREKFMNYAKAEGFTIERQMSYDRKWELPFELRIYKTQMVDIESVNKTTKALRKKAEELGGRYDGWQTAVIKAK